MEFKGYRTLWKAIIRPPRAEYEIKDMGPQSIMIGGTIVQRTDLELKNSKGFTLQCSFFEPTVRKWEELPCVIYMHGNSSCRLEALEAVPILLP